MNRIVFIVGPTASGKTGISIRLARRLNAEIISCDSMQVYRGMDILSQKPAAHRLKAVPHHMLSIISPVREFNVADYKKGAEAAIRKIHRKGKQALIVGGSGLYAKALIDGLFPSGAGDAKLRKRLQGLASKYGKMYLYKRLKRKDPEAAKSIHPNNVRRVIRALEICQTSGVSFSHMKGETRGLSSEHDIVIVGIRRGRSELYDRINRRVDEMFEGGLMDEVRALQKRSISRTARSALGYKEISGCIKGEYAEGEARVLLKRNTRRFAKRQLTWFRKDKRIIWVDVGSGDTENRIADKLLRCLKKAPKKTR